ncbi:MAG: hypothetical protein ISS25_01620 [Nanoarchaeota archaeon]|nr:hypothetical protein [DPANN group archaeon]MBL7116509.1 hypothetical protein [Nanoarchaeota archaeon]
MQHEKARKIIKKILETNVRFEGHFNKCFDNLKETQQEELIEWIKECKEYKINPIQSKKDRNIIGFVKRIGSNLRAILTKEKEGYFIVLFLDKHKYYETEIERIGF